VVFVGDLRLFDEKRPQRPLEQVQQVVQVLDQAQNVAPGFRDQGLGVKLGFDGPPEMVGFAFHLVDVLELEFEIRRAAVVEVNLDRDLEMEGGLRKLVEEFVDLVLQRPRVPEKRNILRQFHGPCLLETPPNVAAPGRPSDRCW